MSIKSGGLIVIGENFNATRKIKASSPRVVREDGNVGIAYTGPDGTRRVLDCTDIFPEDPAEQKSFMIPHIGQAMRKKDLDYITWAIRAQEQAGADIIDLCVDEMSVYPEERYEWMRWLVQTAQSITDSVVAIDSSYSETIRAGLEAHDGSKSRPVVNSLNLEEGRQVLVDMAKERSAMIFANASGRAGMPQNAEERVSNLKECMQLMDAGNIALEDRFLDALVFPIGAGPDYGNHYLDAVRQLRQEFPDVHIFGGHSNVSFGLPRRKLLNQAFITLSIMAGCDAIMVDPIMNPPKPFTEFRYAAEALTAKDEYALRYLKYYRGKLS
ncbi:MAG: dihydropteroate synthase [Acidiferrobacterales bacterium]